MPDKKRPNKSVAYQLPKVEISITSQAESKKGKVKSKTGNGLTFKRLLTKEGVHPYDTLEWDLRTSVIRDEKGNIIHEVKNVEVPKQWSQLATDIITFKYFRKRGVPTSMSETGGETSAKMVVHRVAHSMRTYGENVGGYFATAQDAEVFEAELTHILINQMAAFNSPVWFNVGLWHDYGIEGAAGQYQWDDKKHAVVMSPNAYERPQCSACFIQRVEDDLMSIFDTVKNEARLFKYGSGTGSNFSRLRSKYEKLSGGGTSSGLLSFLEVFDRGAGATKSGGTTRRAAKMVVVDMDHPEIIDFIWWKAREEKKAKILIEFGGFPADFNGEAYRTVGGQNANMSVRVTDEFMKAVEEDGDFSTIMRTTGDVHKTFKAREMMDQVAQAAWECADPGIQFDTTINNWHTCSNTDKIYASNPCSEYLFLDNSACNLSSLNLIHYIEDDGTFNVKKFRHAVRVMTTAMEIVVGFASYPTETIAKNSHDFRPLGIGYANLGTLLMLEGLPYDSDEGRAWAAAITAIEHAQAYLTSAEIAGSKGPFVGYEANREPMLRVMRMHRDAAYKIPRGKAPDYLVDEAQKVHDDMVALGEKNGYRNAQATNIAPTGTIGLLMDCGTTGAEPDFALVKFKKLAGGGFFKIINEAVPGALHRLGYSDDQIDAIITYAVGTGTLNGAPHINPDSLREKGLKDAEIAAVEALMKSTFDLNHSFNVMSLGEDAMIRLGIPKAEYDTLEFNFLRKIGFTQEQIDAATDVICGRMTIEGAPGLNEKHLAIFDCANRCGKYGTRFIEPMGHVKLMAAIQPFISGAISKTINMPNDVTVADVEEVYMQSWKLGLKALALYRDGSKGSQPLSTSAKKADEKGSDDEREVITKVVYKAERRRMPIDRTSITHKFAIAGHDGYLTVGMYEDGKPGEIFVRMAKTGSTINGLLDSWATMTSIALQYGVPIEVVIKKFSHQRFEPAGFTENPNIRVAKSILDYIARWLGLRFLTPESQAMVGVNAASISTDQLALPTVAAKPSITAQADDMNTVVPTVDDDDESAEAFPKPGETDDAPACPECGGVTTRSGTCYKCMNCGSTTGCS